MQNTPRLINKTTIPSSYSAVHTQPFNLKIPHFKIIAVEAVEMK